jgi:hypothetical protein
MKIFLRSKLKITHDLDSKMGCKIPRVQKLHTRGLHKMGNFKDLVNGIFFSWEVAKVVLV